MSKKDKVLTAQDLFDNPKETVSISPAFDLAAGLVPLGSFITLAGQEKLGKSTLALHIVKKFLNQYPDSICKYADIELRLQKIQLTQNNIDLSRIQVQRSEKGNILTGEDHTEMIVEHMKDNEKVIYVLDSTSMLCSSKEYVDPVSGQSRSLTPKLLASFIRKIGQLVPVQDHIVIMISHVYDNVTGYGKKLIVADGHKIQYQSNISLIVKKRELWTEDEQVVGQKNTWYVDWAATKAPGMEMSSFLRYNHGIDEEYELCNLGSELGLLVKSGSWYTFPFLENTKLKDSKIQGLPNVYEFIKENVDVKDLLYQELNKLL